MSGKGQGHLSPDSSKELISRVAQRDNYNCQVCGSVVLPRGNVGRSMYPIETELENEVDCNITVCLDCFEWRPEKEVERKIETAKRLRNATPGLNVLYARKLIRVVTEKTRLFVYAGRALFVRRLIVILSALALLFTILLGVVGLVGVLFVSVETGVQWITEGLQAIGELGRFLVVRSWVLVGGLSVAYALHLVEREREYQLGVQRERRRGGGRNLPDYGEYRYSRWQILAGFSILGVLGVSDWLALSVGFREGSRVGAALLWSAGSLGVVYALRSALYEDRDASGFKLRPTPWVFISRVAFALGTLEITRPLSNHIILPVALTQLGFAFVPVVGLSYVVRRTIERRTGWRPRIPINSTRPEMREMRADHQPPEEPGSRSTEPDSDQ